MSHPPFLSFPSCSDLQRPDACCNGSRLCPDFSPPAAGRYPVSPPRSKSKRIFAIRFAACLTRLSSKNYQKKRNKKELTKEEIEEVFKGEEVKDITIDTNVIDFLITMGVCSSKREAKEFILGNAITINGTKINDIDTVIDNKYLIDNTYVIVKRGKKKYYLGKIK